MTKIIMTIMAMAMSSCYALPAEVQECKTESKQDVVDKQIMLSVQHVPEEERVQIPMTEAKGLQNESTTQWAYLNRVIVVALLGAVGLAAWKFLPRKE